MTTPFHPERRVLVLGAAALVVARPAIADEAELQAAVRAFAKGAPVREGKVQIDIAPLVENGNAVPIAVNETGYRAGTDGRMLPRDIIRRFTCRYDNELVFAVDVHPAIAANPYLAFHTVATITGTLVFTWEGDNGFVQTESHAITVT